MVNSSFLIFSNLRSSEYCLPREQETAYILRHATGESLVIIDELGRATSTADGVAIAWSVAEGLISIGARTMLTTHFQQLAELAVMYPPVHAYHFEVIKSSNG